MSNIQSKNLQKLYFECICELKDIGIDALNDKCVGSIDIKLSRKNALRYGCCKQENPDEDSKYIEKTRKRRIIKYGKFKEHHIEISPWVMDLDEKIIKNTIMHEIIHCFPYCNNHGSVFKKYMTYINEQLGYNISRLGNKKEDYAKSNIQYSEKETYKYKIECQKCGQVFYRKRYNKNLERKYRCGICRGKFKIILLDS